MVYDIGLQRLGFIEWEFVKKNQFLWKVLKIKLSPNPSHMLLRLFSMLPTHLPMLPSNITMLATHLPMLLTYLPMLATHLPMLATHLPMLPSHLPMPPTPYHSALYPLLPYPPLTSYALPIFSFNLCNNKEWCSPTLDNKPITAEL